MADSNHNSGRRRLLQGAAAAWMLSISRVGFAASSHIVAVRVWPSSTYTRVTLESNTPLKYRQFALTHPDRIVIDIEGVQLNSVLKEISRQVQSADPYLKQARVGQFDKNTVRLVLELKQSISPQLFTLKPFAEFRNRLVVDLYPAEGAHRQKMILCWPYWRIIIKVMWIEPCHQKRPKQVKQGVTDPLLSCWILGMAGKIRGLLAKIKPRKKTSCYKLPVGYGR